MTAHQHLSRRRTPGLAVLGAAALAGGSTGTAAPRAAAAAKSAAVNGSFELLVRGTLPNLDSEVGGSLIPGSAGVNPVVTITALLERISSPMSHRMLQLPEALR